MDHQQGHVFSYLSPEERVRKDHPLRAVRGVMDEILREMSPQFDNMYSRRGRPSIPPEKLPRAQLLQMLYSVRSERLLMEEIDYSMLYRWFVGLNLDEEVWDATSFTKNRDRLHSLPSRYKVTILVGGSLPEKRFLDAPGMPKNLGFPRRISVAHFTPVTAGLYRNPCISAHNYP